MQSKMLLNHYAYDSLGNPWCAGGGAYRDLSTHKILAETYEIHFYVGAFPGSKDFTKDGINVHHLGIGKTYLASRITYAFLATLHSLLCRCKLNVVAFSAFSPVLSFLFAPRRVIIEFHHFLRREAIRKYGVLGIMPVAFERLLLRRARYFITSADSIADSIRQIGKGKIVEAVHNGYDSALLTTDVTDEHYILTFGRIDIHMKGLDILVNSFSQVALQYRETNLVIAGRGSPENLDRMRNLIEGSLARSRIRLIAAVDEEEKRKLLRGATFVCIPSRFEGWCIVAIEAAASSKPVLGTRIPGLADTIRDGETGILVKPEDPDALARGMSALLDDADLRLRLGRNGNVWARRFTWEATAELQNAYYQRFLG